MQYFEVQIYTTARRANKIKVFRQTNSIGHTEEDRQKKPKEQIGQNTVQRSTNRGFRFDPKACSYEILTIRLLP